MDTKEARDILSSIRDQNLQFVGELENTGEWEERFLKETWACDAGAKALEKHIPMKPKNMKTILDFSGRYYTSKGDCPACGAQERCKSMLFCDKCGQKLDWGEDNNEIHT